MEVGSGHWIRTDKRNVGSRESGDSARKLLRFLDRVLDAVAFLVGDITGGRAGGERQAGGNRRDS